MAMNLRPQRKNANKHTEHGLRLLEKSIQSDGFIDAQTAAADGEIISGSARLELSAEKFADVEPIIVESDGSRPVVVVRTDIPTADDPRAKRLSVAANQIAKTDFNPDGDLLAEWAGEDDAIRAMFADSEWQEITGEAKPTRDAEPQTDRAAELLAKWQVQPGDLWQIGEHRLICGDCTDAATVARVMGGEVCSLVVTDPPYGVNYEGGANNENKREKLEGDSDALLYNAFLRVAPIADKCAMYLWHADRRANEVYQAAISNGFEVRTQIIWHKLKAHYGAWMAQYKQKHEPCIYCVKGAPAFTGETNEVTVWEYDQPSRNEYHPTEKPLSLMQRAIGNHPYETVYEPFSGSGTTLVACENLRRRCRAIEISPAYVAVALERMAQAFPSLEIKRLE